MGAGPILVLRLGVKVWKKFFLDFFQLRHPSLYPLPDWILRKSTHKAWVAKNIDFGSEKFKIMPEYVRKSKNYGNASFSSNINTCVNSIPTFLRKNSKNVNFDFFILRSFCEPFWVLLWFPRAIWRDFLHKNCWFLIWISLGHPPIFQDSKAFDHIFRFKK